MTLLDVADLQLALGHRQHETHRHALGGDAEQGAADGGHQQPVEFANTCWCNMVVESREKKRLLSMRQLTSQADSFLKCVRPLSLYHNGAGDESVSGSGDAVAVVAVR